MSVSSVYFLGLTTRSSAAHRVFPGWVKAIDWAAVLVGVDVPPQSGRDRYVDFLKHMRCDPFCSGAQVTSHKVRLYDLVADEFEELDPDVIALGEVGGISVRGNKLAAFSPDMLALGDELETILGQQSHQPTRREVVILGGGGAGRAVVLAIARRGIGSASKVTITEKDVDLKADLEQRLKTLLSGYDWLDYEVRDASDNDDIVVRTAPGSLIVNATGMGKDTRGSPVAASTPLPIGSIAWDLNYRGALDFLTFARTQCTARGVMAIDGWDYFLRNWFACLTRIAGREPSASQFERFRSASRILRPDDL